MDGQTYTQLRNAERRRNVFPRDEHTKWLANTKRP